MSKESLQILKIVYGFLSSLTEEQLNNLAKKKARIKYESTLAVKTPKKVVAKVDKIYTELDEMTTGEQARDYLENLSLDRTTLIEISKHYSIPIKSKDTKGALINNLSDFSFMYCIVPIAMKGVLFHADRLEFVIADLDPFFVSGIIDGTTNHQPLTCRRMAD